jgi:hypothetical protein
LEVHVGRLGKGVDEGLGYILGSQALHGVPALLHRLLWDIVAPVGADGARLYEGESDAFSSEFLAQGVVQADYGELGGFVDCPTGYAVAAPDARHRSAYRLCGVLPGAVAVVVSQDGGVRWACKKGGRVTYWEQQ